ncbi:MAG: GNAT family N-acetyltransferase [Flavobacteriaceae bacterium]|nr:GNAT family N-acetyltransferase [Flavobacteriaceae bacterium]
MLLKISDTLKLQPISLEDHNTLFNLMLEIYPPEYKHFWEDGGAWYINSQYSKENLIKELSEPNQAYYFVLYNNEIIGILRLLFDISLDALHTKKAVKLHRIYLHQKMQGKGIGKQLIMHIESIVKQKHYEVLWLEVMQKQPQALHFYENLGFVLVDSYSYQKELLYKKYRTMYAVYKELN